MSEPSGLGERLAGRLELVAPRVRRMLAGGGGGPQEPRGPESGGRGDRLPDEQDRAAIAKQILGASVQPSTTLEGRDRQAEADGIASQLIKRANAALAKLSGGAGDGSISGEDAMAFEAVFRTRGRPALRVKGDEIESIDQVKHPGSSFWNPYLNDHESVLAKVAGATGAVMVGDRMGALQPWVQGTGWLVKPNLVMTNRHVLFPPLGGMRLARRIPGEPTKARFKSDLMVTVDFAFDSRSTAQPLVCPAIDVPFVSEESDPIDVALLRIGPPADGQQLSAPLTLTKADDEAQYLYVVGHPGKLTQIPEEVLAVFGTPDERKRVSFGELLDPDAKRPQELQHDASTIGGFSGGCVLSFLAREVQALHYYGDPLTGNRAFTAQALRNHAVCNAIDGL